MNVLEIMASEKQRAIMIIMNFHLGHPASREERKYFVVEHNLDEVMISYLGEPVARLIVQHPVDTWRQEFVDDSIKAQA